MTFRFDERDKEILDARQKEWDAIPGPRVGDFVQMPEGDYRRFAHDWGDGLQTTVKRTADHFHTSFYFGGTYMEFSGSLDPQIPKDRLQDTGLSMSGAAWFFHHGYIGAHRGVHFMVPCRIFRVMEG